MGAIYARPCSHCGGRHAGVCPRIRAIEYGEDGVTVRRVEYRADEEPVTLPFALPAAWEQYRPRRAPRDVGPTTALPRLRIFNPEG